MVKIAAQLAVITYTRKELEFSFISFQLTLKGERGGLVQSIKRIGFLQSTAGYVVNILLPARRATTHWHPTLFQQYSNMLTCKRYVG